MDRPTLIIYLVSTMLILLGQTPVNLNACPLAANSTTNSTTCHQCDVLRYLQLDRNRQINVNLTVALNLVESENLAGEFVRDINPSQSSDYFFDSICLPGAVRNCEQSADTGSPCTHYVRMNGDHQPHCRWNYTCDYSPNRFPQYIWRANCAEAPDEYRSHEVFYEIPTLKYNSEEPRCLPFKNPGTIYTWKMEKVAVACVCVPQEAWTLTDLFMIWYRQRTPRQ